MSPLVSPLVTRGFKLMEYKQYMDITIIIQGYKMGEQAKFFVRVCYIKRLANLVVIPVAVSR